MSVLGVAGAPCNDSGAIHNGEPPINALPSYLLPLPSDVDVDVHVDLSDSDSVSVSAPPRSIVVVLSCPFNASTVLTPLLPFFVLVTLVYAEIPV
jgi:hypothetical protein